jgi:hypothetical protein
MSTIETAARSSSEKSGIRWARVLTAAVLSAIAAVLGEGAAQVLWPGQDPVGKRVGGCGGQLALNLEVIGVVGDVRAGLEREAPLTAISRIGTSP